MDSSIFDQFDFTFGPEKSNKPDSDYGFNGEKDGLFLPNTEGRTEFLPPDPDRVPKIPNELDQFDPSYAEKPAYERTRELFAQMNPHRQVFLSVLRATKEPIATSDLMEEIDKIRKNKFSVYGAADIACMLEVSGSLNRVNADGSSAAEFVPQPEIVNEDGIDYYVPTTRPVIYWQASEAGLQYLSENNPQERFERLQTSEAEYMGIYKLLLQMAAAKTGTSMNAMSNAADANPLLDTEPRRFYVQHFAESLERCECIAWDDGAWRITETGKWALNDALASVQAEEAYTNAAQQNNDDLPTLTQGVSW